jgi:DegV family protein with EDD domain
MLAAADHENIYPIDTRALSTGGGWLVLYAADLVAQGLSAQEIARKCEEKKQLISTSFVLDTLDFMRRGGRCSGFQALSADLLKIKPCLGMNEGLLGVSKKYRGGMRKVINQYLRDKLEGRSDLDLSRAFVTHTFYGDPEFVEETVALTKQLVPFKEVLVTEAGCSVANHCGPNTLGVLFCHN